MTGQAGAARTVSLRRREQHDETQGIEQTRPEHVRPSSAPLRPSFVRDVAHHGIGDNIERPRQGGKERNKGDVGTDLGVEYRAVDADQHCQRRERELGESIRELDAPRDAAIVLGIHGNFPPPELDSISDEPKEPVVPLRLASRLNIQRGTLWCRGRVYTAVSGSRGLSHALPGHTSRAVALMGHGSRLRVCVSGVARSRHSHKPGAFHTMDVPRVYSKPPT